MSGNKYDAELNATLTQGEIANFTARALAHGWRHPDEAPAYRDLHLVILPNKTVVRGWLVTHLRTLPRAFFTYVDGVARLVEPVAWCEVEP